MIFLEEDDPEIDDGFGPGSDLVLSFLGVVLLLIGVTVVTGLPKAPLQPAQPTFSQSAPQQNSASAPVAPPDEGSRDTTNWRQRALRAEAELGRLETEPPGHWLAIQINGNNPAHFLSRETILRQPMRLFIQGAMTSIGRKVMQLEGNQLEIVGFASPEPSPTPGIDDNLDLSTARAQAVAHFLGQQGVPNECMTVRGMGRGRSDALFRIYRERQPTEYVRQWDELLSTPQGKAFIDRVEDTLSRERQVDILITRDPAANCSTMQLIRALGLLRP